MTTTALPDPLALLPIMAWTVDSDLVVNHVISGQDLSSQLDIKSGVSIALRHPTAAGLLRDARLDASCGGAPSSTKLSCCLMRDRVMMARGLSPCLASDDTRFEDAVALTQRQLDVLYLLCLGLTARQIATRLWVAETTVANHPRGIYARLGCSSRSQAVGRAFRLGIVDAATLDAVDQSA